MSVERPAHQGRPSDSCRRSPKQRALRPEQTMDTPAASLCMRFVLRLSLKSFAKFRSVPAI